ncbi:hypothetical protein SAMN06269173_10844 [Hymenobacter mucosus]|uniref:Lipocalin-like domain-containing protein n=1 Tax=Hymenobacter mucosus TaxID=1411120 RepID=A0A238ZHP6_9BACT|nr:hypothetical protein SAMN06269173_10844 [Hymenobacter mucosus]
MSRTITTLLPALFLVVGSLSLSSCEKQEDARPCGCTPPPQEPFIPASISQVNTWWLNSATTSGKTAIGSDIKDRYSIRFQADGSYIQTLLQDSTQFKGKWMLMGTENRTLHLTDHKGTEQEYTIASATVNSLFFWRAGKDGKTEMYLFKPTL